MVAKCIIKRIYSRIIQEGRKKKGECLCWKEGEYLNRPSPPNKFLLLFFFSFPFSLFFITLLSLIHPTFLPLLLPLLALLTSTYILTSYIYDERLIYLPNSTINLLKHTCTLLQHNTHPTLGTTIHFASEAL